MADVVFTKPAEDDLVDIEYYISFELSNSQASERIVSGILNTAEKLGLYPNSHPVINNNILRRVNLRMTRFGNYNIFYYFDERNDRVYIIRVLYNKVDWERLLK